MREWSGSSPTDERVADDRGTGGTARSRLLEAVRSPPIVLAGGTLLALWISAWVVRARQHSTDRRGLYAAADAALYDAKRRGRAQVSVAAS